MSRGLSNINIKHLKEYLERLRKYENSSFTLDQGKKLVFNKLNHSYFFIRTYHEFYKFPFFRARMLNESDNPNDENSFSYPPLKFNKLGRANLKSKPVFYAADDPLTAIIESLKAGTIQEEVYLSEWGLKDNVSIPTFPVIKNPYQYDDYIKKELFTNFSQEIFETINEIFEVTIRLFQQTSGYYYTAPFCHFLLYHTHICDMVIYPSIMSEYKSVCYAINHDFIDKYFELKKVYKIYFEDAFKVENLEKISNLFGIFKILSVGDVKDGGIVYRNMEVKDESFFNYYSVGMDDNGELQFKSDSRPF